MLVLVAAGTMGAAQSESNGDKSKKSSEPFYRKYLVPGNRLDDQILEQERRVDASPQDASLRNDFGNLLAERRFANEAAEQYEIAARLDRSNFIALYNLGLLRETQGKVSRAMGAYERSIDRKRGFPQSHFRLGRLYEHAGRSGDAVEEYAKALLIDPAMRDPRRNPLVIDSELLFQASLANYPRDVAAASMLREAAYVEERRFRSVPVDRAVSAREVAESDESESGLEPRQIGVGNSAGSATDTPATRRTGRVNPQDVTGAPATVRPRTAAPPVPRRAPRGGTAMIAAPPGSSVAPAPPPAEAPVALPPEPAPSPETMPEPTPAAPVEEEPS